MIKGIQCILFFLVISSFSQQGNKNAKVISLLSGGKNIVSEIKKLDATHANLLNPNESDANIQEVYKSWTEVHQQLQKFLKKNNFKWNVNAPSVKMYNRFYFDLNGNIKVFTFRFFTKVSKETEKKFVNLMLKFTKKHTIGIKRNTAFAQCGKIALPNTQKL
mgnify:CR=1 FL=1